MRIVIILATALALSGCATVPGNAKHKQRVVIPKPPAQTRMIVGKPVVPPVMVSPSVAPIVVKPPVHHNWLYRLFHRRDAQ